MYTKNLLWIYISSNKITLKKIIHSYFDFLMNYFLKNRLW